MCSSDLIKKPKIIKITPEQQAKLTALIRESNLDKEIAEMVVDLMYGNNSVVASS